VPATAQIALTRIEDANKIRMSIASKSKPAYALDCCPIDPIDEFAADKEACVEGRGSLVYGSVPLVRKGGRHG